MFALARAPAGANDDSAAAAPGGGGRGAMPTPFLSLAAAAAAAEAYLRGSPGVRVGSGAGFMLLAEELDTPGIGVCSVANAGRGDLICVDGRRVLDEAVSAAFPFAAPRLLLLPSGSAISSCIDWVSCDDTRSASPPKP